ncbi:MAG: sugar phosphate isomerase/epimerase [Anaerolineae bacterium]|nr:sugar phosphate isomerase/epimerase [Anaerolineae bacterium]
MNHPIRFSVFTKPWPTLPLPQLAAWVHGLGFDGIEFPVRPGYQVEPERVQDLPRAAEVLAEAGVKIFSVAGPADEATIAACAGAGVPVLRVMARINEDENYLDAEIRLRREYDALVPLLDKYGVRLGVQNHCHRFIANAIGLRRLLEIYDPKHIGIVWDAAHEALSGGLPDLALDAVASHLCMVNLKNAVWQRTNGPEAAYARWKVYWTSGRQGLASWPQVIEDLKTRQYTGVVCLTAEYSDHDAVNRLIAEDIAFARELFGANAA